MAGLATMAMAGTPASPRTSKSRTHEDLARDSLNDVRIEEESADVVSEAQYRKLVHRIDRRLITTTGFMYCISLMDRTNIGAANIDGMAEDLGLDVGYRYVSLMLVTTADDAPDQLLITRREIVNNCPRLLRLVHCFPTPSYDTLPEDGSQDIPACHHSCVGNSSGT